MPNREPQNIGVILSSLIKKLGFEKKLSELDAVLLWPEVVGQKIAEISEAIKITDGKLVVKVPDPTWRNQLIYFKREFIAGLNARLGKAVVKDIYLT
jgi:predicted nucleic acid-binding Zn ribbon protein